LGYYSVELDPQARASGSEIRRIDADCSPSRDFKEKLKMTFYLILVLHCSICVILIGIVLAQHGKGADAGAIMGGGGNSNTVFGAGGAADFTTKLTTGLAIAFMVSSILLVRSYQQGGVASPGQTVSPLEGSLMENVSQEIDFSTLGQGEFQIVEEEFEKAEPLPAEPVELSEVEPQ